jgi:excisionase family DNA binding protein
MEKRVLDVFETAEQLGVHPLTVRRAIARGELPAVRVGRKVLVPVRALDEFLAARPAAAGGGGEQLAEHVQVPESTRARR